MGGLAGKNCGGSIVESDALGPVTGDDNCVGGMVVWNRSDRSIICSYVVGKVEDALDLVSGLVGSNDMSSVAYSLSEFKRRKRR